MDNGQRAMADGAGAPAVARSTAAYREVFVTERARLARFARLVGCEPDAVDDVVADAFVAAFEPWCTGSVRDVGAYLRRSVVNQVRDRARREKTRLRWLAARPATATATIVDAAITATGPEAAHVEQAAVLAALRRLPLDQRVAVALRFGEDLSEEATAALLGVPVGTVKSRTARGLARLRGLMEEGDDG